MWGHKIGVCLSVGNDLGRSILCLFEGHFAGENNTNLSHSSW